MAENKPAKKIAIIECDSDLYMQVATTLQHAITGKPVFLGDSLVDLIKRHCQELYEMCEAKGFHFLPSNDSSELAKHPVEIWFNIVRKSSNQN